jgi:MerR family transcriptional regulator, light-induced transcriptional regulator
MGKRSAVRSSERLFSIKQASAETGIPAVTLRAWEARHRIVAPGRAGGNYRVYTARDISLLRWAKRRVDAGTPIRLVAAEAKHLRRLGTIPDAPRSAPEGGKPTGGDPSAFADILYRALIAHREQVAEKCLGEALTAFDLDALCLDVMTPCLWRIGDAWERGEIRVATEHFASNFLRGYLLGAYQSLPIPRRGALILVGCAPSELHDIGALMLALLLREQGRRVEFLGQDLNLEDLQAYIREVRPALVCLSANSEPVARALAGFASTLGEMTPKPRFGFGGRAFFGNPTLQKKIPGIFLGETLRDALAQIRLLLAK